ncbi:SAMTR-like protein, partial [Mya arenaria]
EGKIRLLDVGSCFNPFLTIPEFQAVGIDISPATESVFYCDFLHLRTTEPLQVADDTMSTFINNLKDPVDWLPEESFHVIVFSLLLEYFPAPYQRWLCCEKAWNLLMYNGILVIVTPDSHKQHRNAPMVKSWKTAIESLGFKRWRYVKQEHLHCMVFRKVTITSEDKQQRFLKGITPDMIYIPQDFNDVENFESVNTDYGYCEQNEEFYRSHAFNELPTMTSESDEN